MSDRELQIARLTAWADGQLAPPLTLFAQLTERCSCRCPSCHYPECRIFPKEREMPDQDWLLAVREAAELGVKDAYLVGGEIYQRPALVRQLLPLIKSLGLNGDFTTNGLEVEEEDLRQLVETGWDRVVFSIDAPEPELNDFLRGHARAFAISTGHLKRLLALRAGRRDQPRVGIHTVLSRANLHCLPDLTRLALEIGVEEIYFQPASPISTWARENALTAADQPRLQEVIAQARALISGAGLHHNFHELEKPEFLFAHQQIGEERLRQEIQCVRHPFWRAWCFVPFAQLILYPDGTASTCWMQQAGYRERFPEKTLSDIWYSETFARLRHEMFSRQIPSYCRRCCAAYFEENHRLRERGAQGG